MTYDLKLTKNFNLNEFLVSKTYPNEAEQLKPSDDIIDRLKLLCESIWQPVRNIWVTEPVHVLSGFRNEKLNELIKGKEDSDHLYGLAVDITTKNQFDKFLWLFYSNIPYRQLIMYIDKKMIHTSINIPGRKYKHEAFIKRDNNPNYLPFFGGADIDLAK